MLDRRMRAFAISILIFTAACGRSGTGALDDSDGDGSTRPIFPDSGIASDANMIGVDGPPIIGGECDDDCDCHPQLVCILNQCLGSSRINQCFDAGLPNMIDGGRDGGRRDASRPDSGRDAGRADSGRPDSGQPLPPDAGDPNETPVGAACMSANECGTGGGFCIEEGDGFPDGYCSETCMGGPMSSCPGDSHCRRIGQGMGSAICLDGCADNSECRTGYICLQIGINTDRVCWPLEEGSMNPNGLPVGDACTQDQDCNSGLSCLDPPGPGWDDGYCTKQFCDVQNNPCPSGSLCYNFPGLFSLCLNECPSGGSQSTCRPGYYCLGPTGSPGVCIDN
jgi:hypothetical protein